MKIVVCFKATADIEKISPKDWEKALTPSLSFVPKILSSYDETALAAALFLKRQLQTKGLSPCCISSLTIADSSIDQFLHLQGAIGYDQLIRINPPPFVDLQFYPHLVATQIAAYMKKQRDINAIFVGKGSTGHMGFHLAEILQWPIINNVIDVQPSPCNTSLIATCLHQERRMSAQVPFPIIMNMAHMANERLPIPNLRQREQTKDMPIKVFEPMGFNLKWLDPIRFKRAVAKEKLYIEGKTAKDRGKNLYHHLQQKGFWP